jgi:hypothetical protein
MYLGDFAPGESVRFAWNSAGADGASITRATNGTVSVYKDGGTTQSTAGVTDTEDFDSLTGVHFCTIATTDSFYTAGGEFAVVLSAATIDSKTVNSCLATFSIARKPAGVVVQGLAQAGAAGSITLPAAAVGTDDYYNGCIAVIVQGTGVGQSRYISDYVGATEVASVDPNWATTPDTTSFVQVIASAGPSYINADAKKMNGHLLQGDGSSGDKIRTVNA